MTQQAVNVFKLTDLTTLNPSDTATEVKVLVNKAASSFGHCAAVCVNPGLVTVAKEMLEVQQASDVKVATVVNFPQGTQSLQDTLEETKQALEDGADEIDLVFPYQTFKRDVAQLGHWNKEISDLVNPDEVSAQAFHYVQEVAILVHEYSKKLKVILETGELVHPYLIALATEVCIFAKADFIKTSTGKSPVSATPTAAVVIMETIKYHQADCGVKISGGVKTVEQASVYLDLATKILGPEFVTPEKFRFGASALFDDVRSLVLDGKPANGAASGY